MNRSAVKITRARLIGAVLILVCLVVGWRYFSAQRKRMSQYVTSRVVRQNLVISVQEGGNLQALRSQKIINEVPGQRTILEVVPEGTQITAEDVAAGKVILKLDSKDLEDRQQQFQITVETSWIAYTEAQENLIIQKKQNESDVRQAELKVKFARMDLEKYLGKKPAAEIVQGQAIEYAALIRNPALAGEALNKRRQLESGIDLAREERARAQDKVDWSEKLAEKSYITKSELEADRLLLQQKQVALEQATLASQLFLNYDFPKQVEQSSSDYREAASQLERTTATCQSKLVQAEANVKSKKSQYQLNKTTLEQITGQIAKCVIRAQQPGFVTYATSGRPWQTSNPFQPGTPVYQYQGLLDLPDFASMGVEIKIHESVVEKVKPEMQATVTVDAFPNQVFTGRVRKIALMPDPTLKWLNPDINVYVAQISLDGSYDFLKPGMSARVEILIDELNNVLAVPVSAITFQGSQAFCTVVKHGVLQKRPVRIGQSNEDFIEVTGGLQEGETVAFTAAKTVAAAKQPGAKSPPAAEKSNAAPPAAQPPPAAEKQNPAPAEHGKRNH